MTSVEILANTSLTAQVARDARARGLLAPGDRVLVATSGGADSTALAVLLAGAHEVGLALDLVLGHVDHGWRGPAAADADWAQVEALARRLGLTARRSPPPPTDTPRTEDAARRHRYGWLGRAAVALGCTKVAVGHHLGDQAETFLMRLLRGSGVVGLAGIPRQRPIGSTGVVVVRPLLDVDPVSLRTFLRKRAVVWREDPTNALEDNDRLRIRARIARLLETRPDAAARLAEHAARLRRRVEQREADVLALAPDQVEAWPWADAVSVPRGWLSGLGSPLLLALALRAAGRAIDADQDGPWLDRRHARQIVALLGTGGAVDLPRGLRLRVAGTRVWLLRVDARDRPLPALDMDVVSATGFDLPSFLATDVATRGVALDADRLGEAPTVRRLLPEDRFTPFGRPGSRPVRIVEWLSRRGIPGFARHGTLVVTGDEGVAWVVGQRIDQRHAVSDATRQVARVRVLGRRLAT